MENSGIMINLLKYAIGGFLIGYSLKIIYLSIKKKIKRKDLLGEAFSLLGIQGLLTSQGDYCCTNCGHSDLREKVNVDKRFVGYVFYNDQDIPMIAKGYLYLGFGASDPKSEKAIGQMIVKTLNDLGLETEWDEDPDTKIKIINLN